MNFKLIIFNEKIFYIKKYNKIEFNKFYRIY